MHAPWLRLIGPPAWFHPGGELPFAPERPFQLMALLAHRGDWVPRERLAALFWPDHGAEAARRNLRKVLYRLRDIGGLPQPEEAAGALRWPVGTDIQRIDQALADGDLAPLVEAWAARAFDGLDGDNAFAEWADFERQRLRGRWRAALLQAATGHADPGQAAPWTALLCEQDPLDEEALRAHLQALVQAGRPADARRAYQAFEAALARDLSVRPDAATRALADRLLQAVPPLRAPRAVPDSLPGLGGLIGRQAEQRSVRDRLGQPGVRWLTLLGPGGIGKTRLAQAVAAGQPGAAQVPLQDLQQADEVPARVAQVLGLGVGARSWAGLAHALSSHCAWLVLDNVEQVRGLAAAVPPLLAAAPGLQVLATSRQRLGVPGEQVFEVNGLPYPDTEDQARAADFDAVRLFVQAAQRHRSDFRLEPERDAVAQLCRAVEGWPLALELCAAWTPRLTVAEILHDLTQGRGDLLQAPQVSGDGRPQGLDQVLTQSWLQLDDAARSAAARLSVLDEPAGSEVARAVAGAPLPRLAALADAAWLRREARAGSPARWGLHALVRRFLSARLDERPEWRTAALEALCSSLSQRAERVPPPAQRQAHALALDDLEPDLPALAQAWRCSLSDGRSDRLDRLHGPLRQLLARQQAWGRGIDLLEPAQACLQGQPLARLQAGLAHLQIHAGQIPPAIDRARTALRLLRRGSDRHSLLLALLVLGQGLMRTEQHAAARHVLQQARALARELGDVQVESQVLDVSSGTAYGQGRHDEQIRLLQEAIALALQHGLQPVVSISNLGNALRALGRIDDALAAFERGLALAQGPRLRRERALVRLNLGLLLGDRGRPGDNDRAFESATLGLQDVAGGVDPRIELHLLGLLASSETLRGDAAAARRHLLQALAGARRLSLVHAQLWLLLDWGRWLARAGQVDRAFEVLGCVAARPDLPAADRATLPRLRREWGAPSSDPDPREAAGAQRALDALIDRIIAEA